MIETALTKNSAATIMALRPQYDLREEDREVKNLLLALEKEEIV